MAAGPRLLLLQTVIRQRIIPAASNGLVSGLMWCHNITNALFAPSLITVEARCSQAPGYLWRSVCTFREQIGYSNGKSMNILKSFWLATGLRGALHSLLLYSYVLKVFQELKLQECSRDPCTSGWQHSGSWIILGWAGLETGDWASLRVSTSLTVACSWWLDVVVVESALEWQWRHLSTASWGSICGIPPPPYNNSTLQHCTLEPEHPTIIYYKFWLSNTY